MSSATCRPLIRDAAVRRSSIRPLVHEPMKTVSTSISRIGVPAVRPMYSSARSAETRSLSSSNDAGSGTEPDSGTPWPGLVPQVTNGATLEASSVTTLSNSASSSVTRLDQ